jgi:cobalt-zinc-cadmium efflux system outer membrane protein
MKTLAIVAGAALVFATVAAAQEAVVPERLALSDALRLAEVRNPELAAAAAAVRLAEAGAISAAKRPNPAFAFTSEGFPGPQPTQASFFDKQELSLTVQQEFEPGSRRMLRTLEAQYGTDASRASARDALRRLHLDVRRAYMGVVLAQADDGVARTTLEDIDKVLALNRARYEQGELSGVELRRLQVERFRFADDALAAELALRNARSLLLALLNVRPLDQPFDTVDELLPVSLTATQAQADLEVPDAATSQAIANRPDLDASRLDRERAEAGRRLQHALRTPSFFIGGGYKRDFGASGLIVNFGMPLPFFSRNEGGEARASADERAAAARLAAAEVRVSLEVQQALNAIDVARRRVRYVEGDYLTSAREARDIVLAAYRSGAATLIDLLDAERALREALRTQNRARFDYRMSLFQYEAAVGTPVRAQ